MKKALLLFLLFPSLALARDPNYLKGDRVARVTYAYGSEEPIPGTAEEITFFQWVPEPPCDEKPRPHDCPHWLVPTTRKGPPDFTEHDAVGLAYTKFLQDDVAIDIQANLPLGAPGAQNLALSVAANYYFGYLYFPVTLGYRGDLDAFYLGSGAGVDWLLDNDMTLRVNVLAEYLDADEKWAWTSSVSIGFRF